MYGIFFFLCAGLVRLSHAAYALQSNFNASNWADAFDFRTFDDPAHGYVNYVDRDTAQSRGLFKTDNNLVTMTSDSTSVASGRGRDSLQLISKNQYTHGLFVVDLAHIPENACGMRSTFFTVGPNWPMSGEIDIIDKVNLQTGNLNTKFISDGCSFDGVSCFGNLGCGIKFDDFNAFEEGFNANNGGIYAMEWTSDHISHWFFGRGREPKDVLGNAPDPSRWDPSKTTFVGGNGCDINSHFMNQQIVFDVTFCDDWVVATFAQESTCAAIGLSCVDYVMNHPEAFESAYWTVNVLKVYSDDGFNPVILTTPASTPALSIISPVMTMFNASLPTQFSDNSSIPNSTISFIPNSTLSSSPQSSSAAGSSTPKQSTSSGRPIGITVGTLIGAVALVIAGYLMYRRHKQRKRRADQQEDGQQMIFRLYSSLDQSR